MNFRITRHSDYAPPEDALDRLWERLGARHEQTSFAKGSTEIRAIWTRDFPVSMEAHEREQLGRDAILEIVRSVCERAPELKSDWYAVSARR